MKWHPIIEGLYQYHFRSVTDGNGVDHGNVITVAIERAINLRGEPKYADVWQNDAVRHTIMAVHSARQLGLVE